MLAYSEETSSYTYQGLERNQSRKYLSCSVSGGRTSGMMAYQLKQQYPDTAFVFANTGSEDQETLDFLHRIDKAFDLSIVWLEAVFNGYSNPLTFKVVDYNTASRNGEPFEATVKRFGLPNATFKHCSRELKKNVINRYFKSIGVAVRDRFTAIGIRADEIDRYSASAEKDGIVYPLMDAGKTKKDVFDFWHMHKNLDLDLPTARGNCTFCWKKSENKLRSLAHTNPEVFDTPLRLEAKYSTHFPESQSRLRDTENYMYRGFKSAQWFLDNPSAKAAKDDRVEWLRSLEATQQELDLSPCESCEPW